VHRLPRGALRKRDRHRTSTKFRLGIITWVHELSKQPSYMVIETKKHGVHSEIERKVHSGNAYFYPVQNCFRPVYFPRTLNIRVCISCVLIISFYGYESWSLNWCNNISYNYFKTKSYINILNLGNIHYILRT
jgi:hypothetical protein